MKSSVVLLMREIYYFELATIVNVMNSRFASFVTSNCILKSTSAHFMCSCMCVNTVHAVRTDIRLSNFFLYLFSILILRSRVLGADMRALNPPALN